MTNKQVREKELLQANILKLYKDLVEVATHQVCGRCFFFQDTRQLNIKACNKGLLPITSKGEQCPYYTGAPAYQDQDTNEALRTP